MSLNFLLKKKISVILLVIFSVLSDISHAEKMEIVPGTILILPENSPVKVKWIISPSTENKSPDSFKPEMLQLVIDHKNTPLISYAGTLLINPLTGSVIRFRQPFKKMICLDNGAIIFSDAENLSYAEVEKINKNAIPEASLKPVLRLPVRHSDIFYGDKNSIYAVGYNEEMKRYEIFLFNPDKRLFENIAISDKKINALSGSGRRFYIASGRQIRKFSDEVFNFFYEHPREEILELLYSEEIGLFYKTAHGVGFIKDGYAIEFLNSEALEVFLKGTSLYVFFTKLFGLAEFSGIDDLKRYNFKVEKLIDVKRNF